MSYAKPLSLLFILLVWAASVHAQRPNFYQQWSAEISYGATHLLTPQNGMNLANHLSPHFMKGEIRYMFSPVVGLSANYTHTSLTKVPEWDLHRFVIHRAALEGVVHLGNLFRFDGDGLYRYVNVLAHGGAGVSVTNASDKMISIVAGLSPQVRLSKQVGLKLDASYVANMQQSFGYRGEVLNSKTTGQIMNYSVGVQYYFGLGKVPSDW